MDTFLSSLTSFLLLIGVALIPAVVGVAITSWVLWAEKQLKSPRGTPGAEVAKVAGAGLPPAIVIALVAAGVCEALGLDLPLALIPAPLATGATAFGVVVLWVVYQRARASLSEA